MKVVEEKFYELMREIEKAFPTDRLTEGADKVYWKYLKDIITDPGRKGDFEKGIKEVIQTRFFPTFPTIAEIRNACASHLSWADRRDRKEREEKEKQDEHKNV